ncbi:MAG: NAD-dependent epimerase/dehydratase family protein [Candidatus Baltobacteraceae bacterium]
MILVLGGTRFVGRHIAAAAVAAGAQITLFNRGMTSSPTVNGVSQVHGDRHSDLHRLDGREWDTVIDTCGYTPVELEQSARYFAQRTAQYVFISSISVYRPAPAPLNEDSPVLALPRHADRSQMNPELYGALKAACEKVVIGTFRHRAAIVRPGLVAGPGDPTDRFTYWPLRYARGGTVLAPESPAQPIQYIDARDLAAFTVRLALSARCGIFNAVTEPGSVTFGDLFAACARASGARSPVAYASAAFLQGSGVEPWSDLPLWIPSSGDWSGLLHVASARAGLAGLHTRAVADTARDVLRWAQRAGLPPEGLKAGLSSVRERELLAKVK